MPEPKPKNRESEFTRPFVLIVDDDTTFAEGMIGIFELLGVKSETVSSAAAALEYLPEHPEITHVWTDLNMFKMNGIELAERIKELYPHIQIMLCTSLDRADFEASHHLPDQATPFAHIFFKRDYASLLNNPSLQAKLGLK